MWLAGGQRRLRERPGPDPHFMRVAGSRPSQPVDADPAVRAARNAVAAVFFSAGFIYASWASRIPQIRALLGVGPGVLGLVLLGGAVGSALGTSLSGLLIGWLGELRTVVVMAWAAVAGLIVAAAGCRLGSAGIPVVAAGLFVFGFGNGAWDVAMNVQGAAVERELGRAILPKFHAGWSIGTVAGAGAGAVMVALHVPVPVHLIAAALIVAVAVPAAARRFLPSARTADHPDAGQPDPGPPRRRALAAWTDPRTLLIGLFVLCMAFTEGTGNDWLSLGVIDGYHTIAALGTLTFALFLAAMTAGRWFGPGLIDRYGRVLVLRVCCATALAGLLMIVFGGVLPVALAGAILMGLGTSLGFPVGLSAAADDPRYAAPRVSTAASIGYLAFLAGPPAIGFLADQVGVLRSITVTGVLVATAFVLARFTAPLPRAAERGAPGRETGGR
jgi:MFS family permease